MKFGFRKPSLKKSLKARTTGKIKRAVKRTFNPTYGKKGIGAIKNPRKALYNWSYNKTSFGLNDIIGNFTNSNLHTHKTKPNLEILSNSNYVRVDERSSKYANSTNDYVSHLGKKCIKYEQSIANRALNCQKLICPYCGEHLPKELKKSAKCPFCNNKINLRESGIGLGLLYLTEEESDTLGELRDKFYKDRENNPRYKKY